MLRAFQSGDVPAELAKHASDCRWCAASLLLARTLIADEAEVTVPPRGLVYWKAKLRERREQRERALRPARRMEVWAAGVVLLTPVVVAASAGMVLAALAAGGLAVTVAATIFVLRLRMG
ncbi:MAG: hypothetical protein HY820_10325 [Acidobacteria bacterium]|nr:hypothetical protein [Acidobacteriota bacterium]